MASLNISLPQPLKDYVEAQVKESGYGTPSEFVRELLRQDKKRRAQEKLEEALLEGLSSGAPLEATPRYWREKRRRLAAKPSRTIRKR